MRCVGQLSDSSDVQDRQIVICGRSGTPEEVCDYVKSDGRSARQRVGRRAQELVPKRLAWQPAEARVSWRMVKGRRIDTKGRLREYRCESIAPAADGRR